MTTTTMPRPAATSATQLAELSIGREAMGNVMRGIGEMCQSLGRSVTATANSTLSMAGDAVAFGIGAILNAPNRLNQLGTAVTTNVTKFCNALRETTTAHFAQARVAKVAALSGELREVVTALDGVAVAGEIMGNLKEMLERVRDKLNNANEKSAIERLNVANSLAESLAKTLKTLEQNLPNVLQAHRDYVKKMAVATAAEKHMTELMDSLSGALNV